MQQWISAQIRNARAGQARRAESADGSPPAAAPTVHRTRAAQVTLARYSRPSQPDGRASAPRFRRRETFREARCARRLSDAQKPSAEHQREARHRVARAAKSERRHTRARQATGRRSLSPRGAWLPRSPDYSLVRSPCSHGGVRRRGFPRRDDAGASGEMMGGDRVAASTAATRIRESSRKSRGPQAIATAGWDSRGTHRNAALRVLAKARRAYSDCRRLRGSSRAWPTPTIVPGWWMDHWLQFCGKAASVPWRARLNRKPAAAQSRKPASQCAVTLTFVTLPLSG